MTISMYRKICVTNRHLAQGDFLRQIERVTAAKPTALILREKDLTQEAYEELAVQVLAICREADVACYFHSQPQLAVKLNAQGIHLPLKMAASMSCEDRMRLPCLGISVHSKKEAVEAQKMGAAYIIYGHILRQTVKKVFHRGALLCCAQFVAAFLYPSMLSEGLMKKTLGNASMREHTACV